MSNSFNLDKFNSFLDKATAAVSCDSECQKNKTSEELKQKYLDAQVNLLSAPNQLNVAAKNYITYSQGEVAYNDFNQAKLEETANQIANTFKSTFDDEITNLKLKIDTYDGLLINFTNVVDLYTNYVKENIELEKELKQTTSDVLTNDRKTYYQDQGIGYLNTFYKMYIKCPTKPVSFETNNIQNIPVNYTSMFLRMLNHQLTFLVHIHFQTQFRLQTH